MTSKLILTGFMATGKSAVGRILARRLGWRFIDSDLEIAARAGKSIPAIFAEEGESRFRALERQTIAELTADDRHCPNCGNVLPAVISTGGGALVDTQNCTMLKRAGLVICLTARPEVIATRIGRSASRRPKLVEGGKPLDKRIRELLAERADAYARADLTIDTSDFSPGAIAEMVIDEMIRHGTARCRL